MLPASLPSITATRQPGCTPFSLRSTARSTWMNADTNPRLPLPSSCRNSKYWPTVSSRSHSKNCGRIAPPLNRPARLLKKKGRSPCGSGPSLERKRPRRATVTGETHLVTALQQHTLRRTKFKADRTGVGDFPHIIFRRLCIFVGQCAKMFGISIGYPDDLVCLKLRQSRYMQFGQTDSEYRMAFPHGAKRQRTMGYRLELQGL